MPPCAREPGIPASSRLDRSPRNHEAPRHAADDAIHKAGAREEPQAIGGRDDAGPGNLVGERNWWQWTITAFAISPCRLVASSFEQPAGVAFSFAVAHTSHAETYDTPPSLSKFPRSHMRDYTRLCVSYFVSFRKQNYCFGVGAALILNMDMDLPGVLK
jgi:hypothetical protein